MQKGLSGVWRGGGVESVNSTNIASVRSAERHFLVTHAWSFLWLSVSVKEVETTHSIQTLET